MPSGACVPGHFGVGCNFNISTIFYEHNVYANTGDLPPKSQLDGWSPPCHFYKKLVKQYSVSFIVEVGVWKGKSAACIAQALKRGAGGVLIAVDTWLGALEFWTRSLSRGKPDPTRSLYFNHGYPQVYLHFLANIVRAGLQQYVIPFPVPSRLGHDFLEQLQSAHPDMVHIDAAHEYADAKEDIRMWWGLMRPGGLLLGDDFKAGWSGVVLAACEHAQMYGLEIFRPSQRGYVQKKWWVVKPREGEDPQAPHSAAWLAACSLKVPGGWSSPKDNGHVLTVKSKVAAGEGRRLLQSDFQSSAPARGVNYVPSYARNTVGIWQDYDAPLVDRELGFASSLFGFTSVRVFLNALVYELDPPRFLTNYENLLSSCALHGLTALVTIFDRDFPDCTGAIGCDNPDRAFVETGAYRNSSWVPNPGPATWANRSRWPSIEHFVDDVVGGKYAADERIAGFELMNEPRNPNASSFLAHFAPRINRSTSRPFAIEPQYDPPPEASKAAASVYSYHHYGCNRQCMQSTYTRLAQDASKGNKTVVNVELGQRPRQPYCDAITGVLAAGVGYYAWELMLGRDQFNTGTPKYQGLVWPNGSTYDSVEAACIKHANAPPQVTSAGVGVQSPQRPTAAAGVDRRRRRTV